MNRTLIIGCTGQLGSECMKTFGEEAAGVDFPQIDITDEASVRAAFAQAGTPAAVVNCAAYTAVDKAETEREACEKLNAAAPGTLAKICREHGAFLIHISTDYVFNGEREIPRPWAENEKPEPRSWYGATKLAGENAIRESGCEYAILRTAWLYGVNGKNFPKTMLRMALAGGKMRIVSDQFGSPTCAADLARQICEIAKPQNRETVKNRIYHAVSSGWTSWHGFAEEFLRMMAVPHNIQAVKTVDYPTPAKRPHNSILATTRLRELGLCVMPDWEIALAEFVAKNKTKLISEAKAAGY